MITLGIGTINSVRPKEGQEDLPFVIQRALTEVATWCSSRADIDVRLRSSDLDPSTILAYSPFDGNDIGNWLRTRHESLKRAVTAINQKRSALLREEKSTICNVSYAQSKGRLLSYEVLESVTDGASEALSQGFFDGEDAPPWDTWFAHLHGTIFSWVPESLIDRAQAGIDANPVDCIRWAKWSELLPSHKGASSRKR